MNEYIPDKWLVVKIDLPEETTHKVFACWYGGYSSSDSWKLNSGIESVKETKHYWKFKGFSGSTYKCRKTSYGISNYGAIVLLNMIRKAREQNVEIKMLEDTDWKSIISNI